MSMPPPPGFGAGGPPPPPPPPPYGSMPPGYQPYPSAPVGYQMGPVFAGFGSRLGAWILDVLLLALITLPVTIAAQVFRAKSLEDCHTVTGSIRVVCGAKGVNSGYQSAYFLLTLVAMAISATIYARWVGRGQTPGMKATKIRVVDSSTGQPIGTGRAFGRYFARILSAIPCFLGYFWMLWDANKQTWHDKMVRSVVVKA